VEMEMRCTDSAATSDWWKKCWTHGKMSFVFGSPSTINSSRGLGDDAFAHYISI